MYNQFGVVCIAALESGNDESKARIDYVTQVQKTPGRRIKDKIHTPGLGLPKKTGEILTSPDLATTTTLKEKAI